VQPSNQPGSTATIDHPPAASKEFHDPRHPALHRGRRAGPRRDRSGRQTDADRLGYDDIYFDVQWSHWLAAAIPGTRKRVELAGARLFFVDERAAELVRELREHWSAW
jgi:hypothetical protein